MAHKFFLFLFSLLSLLFLSLPLVSSELKGVGYGKDEGESKIFALSDLTSYIEVEVQSKFESILSETNLGNKTTTNELASSFVKVKSELPVLGAEYKTTKSKSMFCSEALINTEKALILYENKLAELKKNIDKGLESLNNASSTNLKLDILKNHCCPND